MSMSGGTQTRSKHAEIITAIQQLKKASVELTNLKLQIDGESQLSSESGGDKMASKPQEPVIALRDFLNDTPSEIMEIAESIKHTVSEMRSLLF